MRRFNFDEFLWFLVLIVLNIWLIYLSFSGNITIYIEEEMIKYIYITVLLLSIITIFQIKNIFTPKSNFNIKIKLIPILFALFLGVISIIF